MENENTPRGSFLDVAQLRQRTGLPAAYLERLTKAGRLPHLCLGRGIWRYHLDDVEAALRELARHPEDRARRADA